jgi:HTH-type transcriptional repressor of NAD biosynthesis genes
VQDGTRQDDAFRDRQNHWYSDQLNRAKTPHLIVRGTPLARVAAASSYLGSVDVRGHN